MPSGRTDNLEVAERSSRQTVWSSRTTRCFARSRGGGAHFIIGGTLDLSEDTVLLQRAAEGVELMGFEFRHRQPEFARVSAQQLHGTFNRDRIGRQR